MSLHRYRLVLCTGQAQGTSPWCSFAEVLNAAGIDVYLVRIPGKLSAMLITVLPHARLIAKTAGQFERGDEPPYQGSFGDICENVCESLAELGCLDNEDGNPLDFSLQVDSCNASSKSSNEKIRKSPAIPLAMLGFSLGTCFNIGLVQCLQKTRGIEVSHVVSMGGLTHRKMKVCLLTYIAELNDLIVPKNCVL